MKTRVSETITCGKALYQMVGIDGPDCLERSELIDSLCRNGWNIKYSIQTTTEALTLYSKTFDLEN
jgi:hypothetical protein